MQKLKLQLLWKKKLEESGFHDIEQENGMLESWDSHRFLNIPPDHFFAVRDKYINAGQLAERFTINNPFEASVWHLYSEGQSYREIAAQLGSNKDQVQRIVWKLNSVLSHLKRQDEQERSDQDS